VHFVMRPGMVYEYPLWGVGLLLAGVAALGAVVVVLAADRLLSVEFRRSHNDAAAATFSVVGVTFAVLLAFVAMLAWEHFNKAKAASYAEAASVLDVYMLPVIDYVLQRLSGLFEERGAMTSCASCCSPNLWT
jgi:hypothetical protein